MKLKYETVTIEMKNKTQIQGTIMEIDPSNKTFTLEDIIMIPKGRKPIRLKVLITRGDYINYYILPVNPPLNRILFHGNPIESPISRQWKVRRLET